MEHEKAWTLLGDFVDGLLSQDVAMEIETHLEGCKTCRREVEQLRSLIRQAGGLAKAVEPGRDLWPAILTRLRPEKSSRPGLIRRFLGTLRFRPARWATAFAVAAVVLVVLAGLGTWDRTVSPPGDEAMKLAESQTPDAAALAMMDALETQSKIGDQEMAHYAAREGEGSPIPVIGLIVENIRIIDRSIAELREAWKANPDSSRLAQMLAAAYRTKLALQGRATRVATET